jgi:F0F1-type ATP synthase membrane subunit b/b'
MIEKLIDLKTFITAILLSFFGWFLSKVYSYFDIKIKRIDSIEELKKNFDNFKEEYKEDNKELKDKIDTIFKTLIK